MRWMTEDDVYTHCNEAPLVVRLALLFHLVRNRSHIESLSVREDWPENAHGGWQHLESEEPQQPGEMGQAEKTQLTGVERDALSRVPAQWRGPGSG